MTSTPTVEAFMASPPDPEEEHDDLEQASSVTDPLASIAGSLARIVQMAEASQADESEADRLREAHDDLDAKHAVLWDLVVEIEAIVKPSTSKLANTVRQAIDRWRGVPEPIEGPDPETTVEPFEVSGVPADDAPIEDWVAYARGQLGPDVDLSRANRSAIRTLLGIPHPGAA